jgi:hypothetical protein
MFPYNNRIVDVVASFPTNVYTPADVRNESEPVPLTEAGTVPATADFEGRRRLNLDQVPAQQLGMSIQVAGQPRALIPYGEAPGIGQVAVSMKTGVLEFHASDAGLAVSVSYHGRGTPIVAFLFNRLGKELEATQEFATVLRDDVDDLGAQLAGKQNADPLLSAIANLTTVADRLIYTTGVDTVALSPLTSFARSLLDDGDAATARATLGLGTTDIPRFLGLRLGGTVQGLNGPNTGQVSVIIGNAPVASWTATAYRPEEDGSNPGTFPALGGSAFRWQKGWFGAGGVDATGPIATTGAISAGTTLSATGAISGGSANISGDITAGRLFRCPSVPPFQSSASVITLTAASSGGTFVSPVGFELPNVASIPTNWNVRLIFEDYGAYVSALGGNIIDPEGAFGDSALQSSNSWGLMDIYTDGTNYIVAHYRGLFQSV